MSTPVRRALYGRLAGDTTLDGLLAVPADGYAHSVYYQQAPDDAHHPLVIFNKQAGTPTDTFGIPGALENDVWLFKAIDRADTADTVEAVADRLQALLNDAPLSISGTSLLFLRRTSDVDYDEVVDGVQYKHCGSLYRLVTG